MKRPIAVFVFALVLALGGRAQAAPIVGGVTDVTLDAEIAALFEAVNPLGSATLNGLTASFPITGGTTTPTILIEHEGSGLGLVSGGDSLDLRNFLIDVAQGTVFGDVGFDGAAPVAFDVPLFALVINGSIRLALTEDAGDAIEQLLGLTSDLTGVQIATAVPQPKIPEPGMLLLMGMGLVAVGRRLGTRA